MLDAKRTTRSDPHMNDQTVPETVAVTGAAGYIGSHAARILLESGRSVLAIDNLDRGVISAIDALRGLAPDRFTFIRADIADRATIEPALREQSVAAVMHFAALAYVRESVDRALDYHANNTAAAIGLLQACEAAGVHRFVFSSTCAVYGTVPPERIPIAEDEPPSPINPYGWSKLAFERALADHAAARKRAGRPFAFTALRYFNVAGADPAGLLGENHDPETHLIPNVIRAALELGPPLTVFGDDHPTPDGTAVRDYIHVADLARAHLLALERLDPAAENRAHVYNLGSARGVSIRQILEAVHRVTGRPVPVAWADRHPADPPILTADPSRAARELGWTPEFTDLDEIIRHAASWIERRSPPSPPERGPV